VTEYDGFPVNPDTHEASELSDLCGNRLSVYNPHVDIIESAIAHNKNKVFAYFKAVGAIGLTTTTPSAGRAYLQINMDIDNNANTGYCPSLGGYYPQQCGVDLSFEIEMYNGTFNTGHIILHAHKNESDIPLIQSEILTGFFAPNGPDLPYNLYEEWVYYDKQPPQEEIDRCNKGVVNGNGDGFFKVEYSNNHKDAWVCFMSDECDGPFAGVFEYGFSEDQTELEMGVPFEAFMYNSLTNEPNLQLGMSITMQMNLETSDELSIPNNLWASDAVLPFSYAFEDDEEGGSNSQDRQTAIAGSVGTVVGVLVGAGAMALYFQRRAKYSEIPA